MDNGAILGVVLSQEPTLGSLMDVENQLFYNVHCMMDHFDLGTLKALPYLQRHLTN